MARTYLITNMVPFLFNDRYGWNTLIRELFDVFVISEQTVKIYLLSM